MKFFWTPEEEQHFATQEQRPEKPGNVRFDERGNATYAWNDRQPPDNERQAQRALGRVELSLVDDVFDRAKTVNERGARVGYNPYDSGLIPKKHNKAADLRELSKWIETKRRLEAAKRGKS